ncbi:MAG: hypothetical protein MK171_03555 [Pirellulales bacterium]|nr:hypothetical protein [Pirellulales bacterium]
MQLSTAVKGLPGPLGARSLYACLFFLSFLLISLGSRRAKAIAPYATDIGHTELASQLGANTPDGTGIRVQHVEATHNGSGFTDYCPNPAVFGGAYVNSTLNAGVTQGSTGFSSHANGIARYYYGTTDSIAPAISDIDGYEAFHWMGYDATHIGSGAFNVTPDTSGFLNVEQGGLILPYKSDARIANHSWSFSHNSTSINGELLRRIDYIVEHDDFLQIAGVSPSGAREVFASGFNEISVGRTNGIHAEGTKAVDSVYTAGREAPSLVAPTTTTSKASAVVSAVAALLLETAQNGALSGGSQITNDTRTIYHAETSEVIRAVLMASATRSADGGDPTLNVLDNYNIDTANNLDLDYGAGQVNMLHSYNVLAGGVHDSVEDGNGSNIATHGWDYDPSFGGVGGTNATGTYGFTAGVQDQVLKASLVWNIDIQADLGATIPVSIGPTLLYNLDLELWDATLGTKITTLGATSDSTTENTENIFFDGLVAGNEYEMRVVGVGGLFEWDYGIAWQIMPVPEPSSAILFVAAALTMLSNYRHRTRRS